VIKARTGDRAIHQVFISAEFLSSVTYALAPRGTFDVRTDGTGELKTGAVEFYWEKTEDSRTEGALNDVSVCHGRRTGDLQRSGAP
jgi:hypothetical protein